MVKGSKGGLPYPSSHKISHQASEAQLPKSQCKGVCRSYFCGGLSRVQGAGENSAPTQGNIYYITKAQFSKAQTWDSRNLFAINAIWIDVDAHSKTPSFAEAERVHSLLIHALPELAGIPVPNIIIYSGRGFHLIWLIEQCAAKLTFMHRTVSAYYGEVIRDLIAGFKLTKYSVDGSYGANVSGLTRIPGTFNTHSSTYCTYEIILRQRDGRFKALSSVRLLCCTGCGRAACKRFAEAAGAAHKLGGLSGLFFAYFVLSLPNGWIPQRRSSSTGAEGQHTIETSSIRARGSVSTVNRSKKALQNEKRLNYNYIGSYRR